MVHGQSYAWGINSVQLPGIQWLSELRASKAHSGTAQQKYKKGNVICPF